MKRLIEFFKVLFSIADDCRYKYEKDSDHDFDYDNPVTDIYISPKDGTRWSSTHYPCKNPYCRVVTTKQKDGEWTPFFEIK